MGKLFGTDGIRGKAGEYPMTAEMALRVGRAVAVAFAAADKPAKIILGRDTRLSGVTLEAALVAGIRSAGVKAIAAGVIPTPGVAVLTTTLKAAAGIVVSASHNPYYDNGIKIFNGDGYKLSDLIEAQIEELILTTVATQRLQPASDHSRIRAESELINDYILFLNNTLEPNFSLKGLKIVMDCANGATYRLAPALFSELGAELEILAASPDGKNINAACGSEHPEALIEQVLQTRADLGLAFDGDGDRLVAVDEKGVPLTGDQILAVCARDLKQKGRLKNDLVISTVMSNMGLGAALRKMGIRHETTAVGDRYVMEGMVASGAVLGGEDSGHLIFGEDHTSGDGILSALKLIEALQSANKPLSDLKQVMTVFPQALINVDVSTKPDFGSVPAIDAVIKAVAAELGSQGRVLVRYSGTQPLCRVMVEGPSEAETRRHCKQIADIIKNIIGV